MPQNSNKLAPQKIKTLNYQKYLSFKSRDFELKQIIYHEFTKIMKEFNISIERIEMFFKRNINH